MKRANLLLSTLPLVILIATLFAAVKWFGGDITSGPSQIALLIATLTTLLISTLYLKVPWSTIERAMIENLSQTGSAIFILLMIGAITASWMISGVVPTMIYYGLKVITPSLFLVVAFLLSGAVSVMSGSSWTTVGTIGVALLTAGEIIGFPSPWLAGAVISGAYLGDKISPLSDTTNLAASVAGVDLYLHIRYMLITTIPAFILTLIFFGTAGFLLPQQGGLEIDGQLQLLSTTFNISPALFLLPLATILLIVKKVPPFITLAISALLGAILALLVQPHLIAQIVPESLSKLEGALFSTLKILSSKTTIETGDVMLNKLLTTSGMSGMLDTVWIILMVVAFGGAMSASGMIATLTEKIVSFVKSGFSLVASTTLTTILFNIALSEQYISILIPGKMFSESYRKMGYKPQLLSRTLEDAGTVTSVLVPWNTCGVVQSTVLGVATLSYLPYCFFNIATPLLTLLVALFGYKIERLVPEEEIEENIEIKQQSDI